MVQRFQHFPLERLCHKHKMKKRPKGLFNVVYVSQPSAAHVCVRKIVRSTLDASEADLLQDHAESVLFVDRQGRALAPAF